VHRDRPIVAGAALAVLLTKYSFGVPVLAAFIAIGRHTVVAVALALTGVALLLFALWTHTPLVLAVTGPLSAAAPSTGVGPADVMSLVAALQSSPHVTAAGVVASGVLMLGFGIAWSRQHRRGLADERALASAVILSLAVTFHLGYDHAMLFVAAALLLRSASLSRTGAATLVGVCVLLWVLPRVLGGAAPAGYTPASIALHTVILLACSVVACAGRDRVPAG
jgi:hypothetical protein